MMYIYIKADTNDADYIVRKSPITTEQLDLIMPLIEAIKNFKPYTGDGAYGKNFINNNNFPTMECIADHRGEISAEEYYTTKAGISVEVFNIFEQHIPYSEHGIHTIEEISVFEVVNERLLL